MTKEDKSHFHYHSSGAGCLSGVFLLMLFFVSGFGQAIVDLIKAIASRIAG